MSDSTVQDPSATAKIGFFDLPPELRLQIYNYLLPYRKFLAWGCSISFIRTNRQIHEEACEAFYGSCSFDLTVRGWSPLHPTGYVNFLTQTVDLDDIPDAAIFRLLRRIKRLRLRIEAQSDERAVCEVRDVLTALLRHLDSDHQLEKLDVTITITIDIKRTAKNIRPQDVPPPLLFGFITEPLRMIRRSRHTVLKLSISGDESQPLPDFTESVQAAIDSGDTAASDVDVLSSCFAILRRLFRAAHALPDHTGQIGSRAIGYKICRLRIIGDLDGFKSAMWPLMLMLGKLASNNLKASLASAKAHADRLQLMQNLLALREAVTGDEQGIVAGRGEQEGGQRVNIVIDEAAQKVGKRKCDWPDLGGGRKKARVVCLDDSSDSDSDGDA